MMVRFLSQDGNVMSEEFMGKTDRWDGFQGLEIISIIPREPGEPDREARVWTLPGDGYEYNTRPL